jgi:hypothetical protein
MSLFPQQSTCASSLSETTQVLDDHSAYTLSNHLTHSHFLVVFDLKSVENTSAYSNFKLN